MPAANRSDVEDRTYTEIDDAVPKIATEVGADQGEQNQDRSISPEQLHTMATDPTEMATNTEYASLGQQFAGSHTMQEIETIGTTEAQPATINLGAATGVQIPPACEVMLSPEPDASTNIESEKATKSEQRNPIKVQHVKPSAASDDGNADESLAYAEEPQPSIVGVQRGNSATPSASMDPITDTHPDPTPPVAAIQGANKP